MLLRTPATAARRLQGGGYNGWLSYTAAKVQGTFDAFNGSFSVPDEPEWSPEQLYIFTGLQNVNWIPKVDPDPEGVFDIIQPVLQYPGDWGLYWSVKSWYVTLDSSALVSPEVRTAPGDTVLGLMYRTDDTSGWAVSSVVNGKATTIKPDTPRLTSQPWAYTTVECYGCDDTAGKGNCATLPTKPCDFTGMALTSGGKSVEVDWAANPQPSHDVKCKTLSVDIQSSEAVTYNFA
jgi:hypothetical protein